ncbi:hypothetical protein Mapa_004874 [Marchantia paleacea]|nr:hypothetical protein Mapa_004874 [Marchantia paleacea]
MTSSQGPQGHDDERGEDLQQHVRPSGWKAAWEQAQDALAPSPEIKKAADTLVWCELLQQSMGWLLLTQIGVLLGSFGQVMSQGVCLLSWGIFTLEAILKYGRSWAHSHYFRDVPCAYVALHDHQEAAHNSLAVFGLFVLSATLLEVSLYVPYIYSVLRFWHVKKHCYDEHAGCPDGTTRLIEMLIITVIITCVHWVSSLGTVLAFKAAMGMGITALAQNSSNYLSRKLLSGRLRYISRFSTKRDPSDRLLCLTWWVHMARHRHLSAVVASAQPSDCGLPGHWFESVEQLKSIVDECDNGDHVHLDTSGLLWVSQEMALRALISLAKQRNERTLKKIVSDDGFLLLVRVVREGRTETCRGLAAAAIAVLATQPDVLGEQNVDFTEAVVPLKRLARSTNVEHIEVAYGALLNASLHDRSNVVISSLLASDESGSSFMSCLIRHAHISHTTRCQELAVGLLSCLVGSSKGRPARTALTSYVDEQGGVSGVQLCTALINHGLTPQIQVGAAGVLAEIAYWKDGQVLGNDLHIESCIQALVEALRREYTIAFSSAKALCSLAYNNQAIKVTIVKAGGISCLVDLLRDDKASSTRNRGSFGRRDSRRKRLQRLPTGISCEAPGKTEEELARVSITSEEARLEENVRSDAARALRILALNNPEHQKLIVDAGAIPLLINLMTSANPKVHVQAIPALSALSYKSTTNKDLIGECDGGKFFSGLMEVLKTSEVHENMAEVILEKVGHATKSLVDGNESNRQNALKQGLKEKFEDCIANTQALYKINGKAIQSAKRALESLEKEQPT